MKNGLKKIFSVCITTAMVLATVNFNVMAAGFNWPTFYDMTTEKFSTGNMANACLEEGHENVGYFADPEDPENDVVGSRRCTVTGKYADMRAVMNYTDAAIQFDFDIYRVDKAAEFEIKLFANTGGASGNNVSLFKMDTAGRVVLNGNVASTYDAGQWYSVRIKSNKSKTYHEVYMKKKSEDSYKIIGYVSNADLLFTKDVYIHYFMKNSSAEYTYFDNMSWKELAGDINKKVHYDFNNEISKTGSLYGLTINSNNMIWSTETFAGQTTLKAKMNETSAREIFNWEDIPDMEKVYVETSMGFDAGEDETKNLPFQFGIRPVFAEADGTKGGAARNNMSEGIRFNYSRYITLEGATLSKPEGASLSNNVLYKAGYVYDRENSEFKAYFIAANGKTFVQDASSNAYVQSKRYLAGMKLYQRAYGNYMTGAGYYDYLYIDEADAMQVDTVTPTENKTDVSLVPEIKFTYNYVIDPNNIGTAVLVDSDNNEIPVDIKTSFGKTLVVTPLEKLSSSKTYKVTVSGVKDLLGQEAEEYSTSFMTGKAINIDSAKVNDNDKLIDGLNNIQCSLSSNDGDSYNVIVIAAIYDLTTNDLLGAEATKATVASTGSSNVSFNIDTSDYSNYSMELYVWSGFGTMKPYASILKYTK